MKRLAVPARLSAAAGSAEGLPTRQDCVGLTHICAPAPRPSTEGSHLTSNLFTAQGGSQNA